MPLINQPEPQRPAPDAWAKRPSAADQLKAGGSKMVEPAPTPTLGADTTIVLKQDGQTLAQGVGVAPVGFQAKTAGDDTNLQTTPDTFPRNAGSRAPVQGSAPGPRNLGRTKTR